MLLGSSLPRPPWRGRRVVLGVTGGIAAYKAVQFARDLTALGAKVDVILTRSARRFVGAVSFEGVTGRAAFHSLWSAVDGKARHLALADDADLVVVAPATADFLARAAAGRADDLLSAVLLATRAPVLLAPAMNERMWEHPLTRDHVERLASLERHHLAGPAEGPLAVGEGEGLGRMVEPEELVVRCGMLLGPDPRWVDRRVVVTAGPTREPVDAVRYVGNRSSGRMGFALAQEAAMRGARVTLVTGPSGLPDLPGIDTVRIETAREMLEAVRIQAPHADVVVYAAAVADFRPAEPATAKRRKEDEGDSMRIDLVLNPDVAEETRALLRPTAVSVGFALESDAMVERARKKMKRKGFDVVVANPAGEADTGFDVPTNRVTLVRGDEVEEWPLMEKEEVARRILDRVGTILHGREEGYARGGDEAAAPGGARGGPEEEG